MLGVEKYCANGDKISDWSNVLCPNIFAEAN